MTWPRLAGVSGSRVVAVDVARGVALIGMMAAHVLPYWTIAYGRAAALFAFLAGVGVALVSGGEHLEKARPRSELSVSLAIRAVFLLTLGLLLGWMAPLALVILPYYAVLFVFAIPFLRMRIRPLIGCALVAALLVPVVVHLMLDHLPSGERTLVDQPDFSWLAHPWPLFTALAVTGIYPALPWMAYLLSGMAVGRSRLREARTAWVLVGVGVVLAVGSFAVSWLMLGPAGGLGHIVNDAALPRDHPAYLHSVVARGPITVRDTFRLEGYGTVPSTSWWWLALAGPHTSTPFDLVHTVGTSLLVLGSALLLVRLRVVRAALTPLAAAGSMTLTLYTLHLVALRWGPLHAGFTADGTPYGFGKELVAHPRGPGADHRLALAILARRGPLEQLVHTLSVDLPRRRRSRVNLPATRPGPQAPATKVD